MAAGEKPGGQKGGRVVNTAKGGGAQHTGGLINLLKDGLKDGNVEAQEYALWSLSNIAHACAHHGAPRPSLPTGTRSGHSPQSRTLCRARRWLRRVASPPSSPRSSGGPVTWRC